jgi:hypothetical protein
MPWYTESIRYVCFTREYAEWKDGYHSTTLFRLTQHRGRYQICLAKRLFVLFRAWDYSAHRKED